MQVKLKVLLLTGKKLLHSWSSPCSTQASPLQEKQLADSKKNLDNRQDTVSGSKQNEILLLITRLLLPSSSQCSFQT